VGKVHLSPEQQAQIITASRAVNDPQAFAARVHERLVREPEIGEGVIYRACREAQRELLTPPPDTIGLGTHQPQPLRKIR
jgi:hypothetical protein